jgi:hypothetical protein
MLTSSKTFTPQQPNQSTTEVILSFSLLLVPKLVINCPWRSPKELSISFSRIPKLVETFEAGWVGRTLH